MLDRGAISFVRRLKQTESFLFCELSFGRCALSDRRAWVEPAPLLQVSYRQLVLTIRLSDAPGAEDLL
jgi:hypothetical protein